jgi:hypothetical protein
MTQRRRTPATGLLRDVDSGHEFWTRPGAITGGGDGCRRNEGTLSATHAGARPLRPPSCLGDSGAVRGRSADQAAAGYSVAGQWCRQQQSGTSPGDVVGLPADREVGEPVRDQDGDLDQRVEFAGPRAALIPRRCRRSPAAACQGQVRAETSLARSC